MSVSTFALHRQSIDVETFVAFQRDKHFAARRNQGQGYRLISSGVVLNDGALFLMKRIHFDGAFDVVGPVEIVGEIIYEVKKL